MILAATLKCLYHNQSNHEKAFMQDHNNLFKSTVFKFPSLIHNVYSVSFNNQYIPSSQAFPPLSQELCSSYVSNRSKASEILRKTDTFGGGQRTEIWVLTFDNISCDTLIIMRPTYFDSFANFQETTAIYDGHEKEFESELEISNEQSKWNAVIYFQESIDVKNVESMLSISLSLSKFISSIHTDFFLHFTLYFNTFQRCFIDEPYELRGLSFDTNQLNDRLLNLPFKIIDQHITVPTEVLNRVGGCCGYDEIFTMKKIFKWKLYFEAFSTFTTIRDFPFVCGSFLKNLNPYNEYHFNVCIGKHSDEWSEFSMFMGRSQQITKLFEDWTAHTMLTRPSVHYNFQLYASSGCDTIFRGWNAELSVSKLLSLIVPPLHEFKEILNVVDCSYPKPLLIEKIAVVDNYKQSHESFSGAPEELEVYFEMHSFRSNFTNCLAKSSRPILSNNNLLPRFAECVMIVSQQFLHKYSDVAQVLWKQYKVVCLDSSFVYDIDIFCGNGEAVYVFSSFFSAEEFQRKLKMIVEGATNLKRIWLIMMRDNYLTPNDVSVQLLQATSKLPCNVIFKDCLNCADDCAKVLKWILSHTNSTGCRSFSHLIDLMECDRFLAHCDFLQRFPGINYWNAALMLSKKPLAQHLHREF